MKLNPEKVASFKKSFVEIVRPRQLGQFLALQFMFITLLVASVFMFGAAIEFDSNIMACVSGVGLMNAYEMLKASDAIEI